jgi:hypothetical protein
MTSPQISPTEISPKTVYDNLSLLEQVGVAKSALYRQLAQDVLADNNIKLSVRIAIAERLNHANHLLELGTVGGNDSY